MPKKPSEKKTKNAYLVNYLIHDQVMKSVIRCERFDTHGDQLWMFNGEEEEIIAVFKVWVSLEKIPERDAAFMQEELLDQDAKRLDNMFRRDSSS